MLDLFPHTTDQFPSKWYLGKHIKHIDGLIYLNASTSIFPRKRNFGAKYNVLQDDSNLRLFLVCNFRLEYRTS